ncbi:MAG: aminopeptidase P family protein [Prevotella sp.]|nr:aminopeptidase P family protein [Prevotella sp.]
MNIIQERLEQLREELRREYLSAFVFPTTDPHNSEYTADHWKGREWISGFTGSAGIAVVTQKSAALWTDSRYFIQAEEQLRGTEYLLMRQKMTGTPAIPEWLASELAEMSDKEVGVDGMVNTVADVEQLKEELRRRGGITVRTNFDPLQRIWKDRPAIPQNPVEVQPLEFSGEETKSKLARIRQALRHQHADGMLVTALDDIAWTLNLRGSDVHCNPVFVSYLLIASDKVTLYINKVKVTDSIRSYLQGQGVEIADYMDVAKGLRDYFEYNILLDPEEVCYTLSQQVTRQVVRADSPIPAMKAVKNEREQSGFRSAMLRDGIAMVRFLKWLDEHIQTDQLTEMSVSDKLESLRAEQPLYKGLSFDTIAGYEAHGAIVHYEATPATDAVLQPKGFLLLDSGAQYQDGTTDITRTIALGPLTEEQRKVYTLVLKGHLQLQNLHFPDGASGTQLDAIARKDLWQADYNYLHGTGHGVGSYLNVHEGPHQIRMEWRPAPLHAGMTVTDEPGVYLEGRFGVRIENTLLITPDKETECGRFLRFEPLTICPVDKRPIVLEMLTEEEKAWLNQYHENCYALLSSSLDEKEQEWLREATLPI